MLAVVVLVQVPVQVPVRVPVRVLVWVLVWVPLVPRSAHAAPRAHDGAPRATRCPAPALRSSPRVRQCEQQRPRQGRPHGARVSSVQQEVPSVLQQRARRRRLVGRAPRRGFVCAARRASRSGSQDGSDRRRTASRSRGSQRGGTCAHRTPRKRCRHRRSLVRLKPGRVRGCRVDVARAFKDVNDYS